MAKVRLPVHVLTGFLGAGKTTLLRRVLASDAFADSAVLINEFGEIGLDHHLVGDIAPDLRLLASGCVCCSIRGELRDAILDLHGRRERGEIPPFRRLLIETTGLAEPGPILATLLHDPRLAARYRPGEVVTVVDAVNGSALLASAPESIEQVAAADRLLLSKTDLVDAGARRSLEALLARINPAAERAATTRRGLLKTLFSDRGRARFAVRAGVAGRSAQGGAGHDHARDVHGGVTAFAVTFDHQIDWTAFGVWLSLLLNRHGASVLRVKGLLDVAGADTPVVVNGVQHLIHPPFHLKKWPGRDRTSRLLFIVRGLDRDALVASLNAFVGETDGAV